MAINKDLLVTHFLNAADVLTNLHKYGTFDKGKIYHISLERTPINEFKPRIPKRPAYGEDRTVPRISASKTIYGCLRGIVLAPEEFKKGNNFTAPIYEYDGEFYQPSTELVPDIFVSNEVWILKKPRFKEVGSIYFHKDNSGRLERTSKIFLEVTLNNKIYFEEEGLYNDVMKKLSVKDGFDPKDYKTYDEVFFKFDK